jgi:regulator of sirC expression with transglutaminase-like and TPR domain
MTGIDECPTSGPWWLLPWARFCSGEPALPGIADGVAHLTVGAMLLAAHSCTSLPTDEAWHNELERLRRTVLLHIDRFVDIADPIDRWVQVCTTGMGLAGDTRTYHDPRNSFLPDILRRRQGLPIGLAVVWLQVAHSLHMPAYGVGMPGHFLVGAELPHRPAVYIDCFHDGQVLDAHQCATLYERLFSGRPHTPFHDVFLQAVDTPSMLIRMVANLKQHAARRRDLLTLCDLARLRWFLPLVSLDDARELIRLCAATGTPTEARHWLDLALNRFGDTYPAAQLAADRRTVLAGFN